jgi:Peptidase family S41
MKSLRRKALLMAIVLGAVSADRPVNCMATDTNALPHFQEVFRLLRANLPNTSEEDLNRAAVQGLLSQFYPRVILATNGAAAALTERALLDKTTVYDQSYGYLRVAKVGTGLADQIKSACEKLDATNRLKGVVLDLRFAAGQDYAAAANAADRFLTKEQPLLDWEEGSARSTAKTNAIRVPVVVLMNRETTGAAEALAAALRETDAAVLIGSRTAGQAEVYKEFELSNGQRLRIATGQVSVGKGKALSTGVEPDIEVAVSAEDEKAYFTNAFKVLAGPTARLRATNTVTQAGPTNRTSRRRLNEAELVRMQREGLSLDEQDAASPKPPEGDSAESLVRDPALARALDLLKGIAIVERSLTR